MTSAAAEAEAARVAALRRYEVLDTPREESFDRLARLAARVLGTPIAAVSLVDAERVWFKAAIGLDATEIPRGLAMCDRTVTSLDPVYELADTHGDPTLSENPLIHPPVDIRFYAGGALVTPDGHRIGTLCVIDRQARPGLTEDQRGTLIDLASTVMTELERGRQQMLRERAAGRLALINDILALVGGATGFVAAIEAVITQLCRHTGALEGNFSDEPSGGPPRTLAFAAAGEMTADWRARFVAGFTEAATEGRLVALPADDASLCFPEITEERAAQRPELRLAFGRGARALLLQPLRVGSVRYGLVLRFATPRADLADVAALLVEVGQAIRPALQRKQAEDRLGLLNAILAEVGGAAGFAAAFEAAMRLLCIHTGAAFAHLWQRVEGAAARRIASAGDPRLPPATLRAAFTNLPATAPEAAFGPLLAGDEQVLAPQVTEAGLADRPLLIDGFRQGMRAYLFHPLPVGAARYGLLLKFYTERRDLSEVAALLNEVGQAIRPALLRKQAEERLALLNDVLSLIAGAPNFQAGIERAITRLCQHTGAYAGQFWGQLDQGALVRMVALAGPAPLPAALRQRLFAAFPFPAERSLLAPVMAAGARMVMPMIPPALAEKYPLLRLSLENGTRSFAAQGFAVGDAHYMLILVFDSERGDLDDVADLLGEMAQAIHPALLRKHAEDRLTLITGVLASFAGTASFRDAIEAALQRLCADVGALAGVISRRADGTDDVRLVGLHLGPQVAAGMRARIAAVYPLPVERALLTSAADAEARRIVPELTEDMAARYPLVRIVREFGGRSVVGQSLVVGPHLYVLALVFGRERPDLEQVADLLDEIAHAIRPALQRKQAEEGLALLQAAMDATADVVVVTDAARPPHDQRVLQVNPAFTRMTGYRPEDIVGRNMRVLQGRDTDPSVVRRLHEAVAACRPARAEILNYRRDGTPFWVELDIAPFADERGEVANWVGVLRDATERRETQEALQRLAGQLQDRTAQLTEVARLARIGSWEWRADREQMDWSDETYELFGVAREGFVPTMEAFLALLHPEDAERAGRCGARARQFGRNLNVEVRVPNVGGRLRTIIWNGGPVGDGGSGVDLRGYCQDVTEQRETEAALRHGEKLRVLGQLTGGIAHEFNNLLTIVLANLEMALDETEPPPDPRPELEAARRAAQAGADLTARLLSFARSEPLRREPTDIAAWLEPLRDMATRTLGQRYDVSLEVDPVLPPVALDRSQLEGAVLNLVLNARDAMPIGGVIAITASSMTVPRRARGALADLLPGTYLALSVRDSGAGMPADVAERAFEPFFTTKPAGSGTGLGLSMVLSFARQSGGTALIETAPGQGTAVRIVLPMT